ncbi:MAG TPA: hypothetical protein VFP36_02195, partial [Usitatibacter sp.]|nr:hypothetical protein [Usitatibacter sp.]
MGLLGTGFGEIGRKLRRLVLRQQINSAGRAYSAQLRNLGKRAVEAGITGPADDSLKAGLADTESRDRDLAARLAALDEDIRKLEAQRDADAQRFASMRQEVLAKKAPLDAHLAALQKAAASAPDKGAAANPEMDRLKEQIAPLKAELDRIEAERSQGASKSAQQLTELRKRRQGTQNESAAVSRERGLHFEKLGAVLAAAGIASPALANELAAVAATAQAQAALQARHDASLAESRGMPKGTMAKFAALMLGAGAVLAAGGYAVNRAREPASPARRSAPAQVAVDECGPMPSFKQKVRANPGGPYNIIRGR